VHSSIEVTNPFHELVETLNRGLVAEPKKIDTLVRLSGMDSSSPAGHLARPCVMLITMATRRRARADISERVQVDIIWKPDDDSDGVRGAKTRPALVYMGMSGMVWRHGAPVVAPGLLRRAIAVRWQWRHNDATMPCSLGGRPGAADD
jgi:hypothetical protein